MLIYKVLLAGQYLYSVPNHFPVLFVFPLSLVLAAADFILIYMIFRILDCLSRIKLLTATYFVAFMSSGCFCVCDIALFLYFRGFYNFGLERFLSYSPEETARYNVFSVNFFSVVIATSYLFLLSISLFSAIKQKPFIIKPFSDRVLSILLAVNVVFCIGTAFLPFEETVGLEKSPLFEYFSTRILSSYYLDVNKEVEPAEYPGIADERENFPKIDFDFSATKGKNVIFIIIESTAFERTPLGSDKKSNLTFLTDLSEESISFVSHRTIFLTMTSSTRQSAFQSFRSS